MYSYSVSELLENRREIFLTICAMMYSVLPVEKGFEATLSQRSTWQNGVDGDGNPYNYHDKHW